MCLLRRPGAARPLAIDITNRRDRQPRAGARTYAPREHRLQSPYTGQPLGETARCFLNLFPNEPSVSKSSELGRSSDLWFGQSLKNRKIS